MSEPGTANDWVQFWQNNQKSLFQSWAEGKMPAFRGPGAKPSEGGVDPMGEMMKRSYARFHAPCTTS